MSLRLTRLTILITILAVTGIFFSVLQLEAGSVPCSPDVKISLGISSAGCGNYAGVKEIGLSKPTVTAVDASLCQSNYAWSPGQRTCAAPWRCFKMVGAYSGRSLSSAAGTPFDLVRYSGAPIVPISYDTYGYSVNKTGPLPTAYSVLHPVYTYSSGTSYTCAAPPFNPTAPISDLTNFFYAPAAEATPVYSYVNSSSGSGIKQNSNLCANLPAGWGCYYKNPTDTTARVTDTFTTYHTNFFIYGDYASHPEYTYINYDTPGKLGSFYPAFPFRLVALCDANVLERTDPVTGKYTNVLWSATTNHDSDLPGSPNISWRGAVTGSEVRAFSFVRPGTKAIATITGNVKNPYNQKVINSDNTTNNSCSIVVPPIVLSCTAKLLNHKDPNTGAFTNVRFSAATTAPGATTVEFKWSGSSTSTRAVADQYIQPGTTARATLSAVAVYGKGANAVRVNFVNTTCGVKVPQTKLLAECKGVPYPGGVTWTANTSYSLEGVKYPDQAANSTFVWKDLKTINPEINVEPFPRLPLGPRKVTNSVTATLNPDTFDGAGYLKDTATCSAMVCPAAQFDDTNWGVTVFGGYEDIKGFNDPKTGRKQDKVLGGGGIMSSTFRLLMNANGKPQLWANHSWFEEYVAYPMNYNLVGGNANGKIASNCGDLTLQDKCILVTVPQQTSNGHFIKAASAQFPIWDRGPDQTRPRILDMSMGAFVKLGISPSDHPKVDVKLVNCTGTSDPTPSP